MAAAIWVASSRVGARIRPVGAPEVRRIRPSALAWASRATTGIENARVLPEPVLPRPSTSPPARVSARVAAWISKASVFPSAASTFTRLAGTPRDSNVVVKVCAFTIWTRLRRPVLSGGCQWANTRACELVRRTKVWWRVDHPQRSVLRRVAAPWRGHFVLHYPPVTPAANRFCGDLAHCARAHWAPRPWRSPPPRPSRPNPVPCT